NLTDIDYDILKELFKKYTLTEKIATTIVCMNVTCYLKILSLIEESCKKIPHIIYQVAKLYQNYGIRKWFVSCENSEITKNDIDQIIITDMNLSELLNIIIRKFPLNENLMNMCIRDIFKYRNTIRHIDLSTLILLLLTRTIKSDSWKQNILKDITYDFGSTRIFELLNLLEFDNDMICDHILKGSKNQIKRNLKLMATVNYNFLKKKHIIESIRRNINIEIDYNIP